MAPEDEERTAFITERGLYCYKVMPFGLKNAGATYQRLVNKIFQDQIGHNMEVYVDDMLVKSVEAQEHIKDLQEAFGTLRKHRMIESHQMHLRSCFGKISKVHGHSTRD